MAHPSVVINGVTYSTVPSVQIPKTGSGTATFYDASECTAASADLLAGKKAITSTGEIDGGMTDNGATGGTISTKAGSVAIPAGYTSGGSVTISTTEQNKIIAGNIKSGVTILGVAGSMSAPTISQNSSTKVLSIS